MLTRYGGTFVDTALVTSRVEICFKSATMASTEISEMYSSMLSLGGYYVKVQMPTGDTTVVLVDENSSFQEVIEKLQVKKEIKIEGGSAFVHFAGKVVPAFPAHTLSNFKDIDKICIYGTICILCLSRFSA
jgi:hypothetical protein